MRQRDDVQACVRGALRRRRRSLGLTQADVAQLLGMRRLTYHRIETGARRIRFLELAVLCEVLQCHVGELLQDGQLTASYFRVQRLLHDPAGGWPSGEEPRPEADYATLIRPTS